MKTIALFTLSLCTVLCMACPGNAPAQEEAELTGLYEGKFMIDFRTQVKLDLVEGKLTGSVRMYEGDHQIQDDALTRIQVSEKTLSFYIDAKETEFKGNFNEDCTEFSGHFIFPDGSKHPFEAKKK